jgi:hypothetical protein
MNILNGMIIEINKTKIANARQTCASAIWLIGWTVIMLKLGYKVPGLSRRLT